MIQADSRHGHLQTFGNTYKERVEAAIDCLRSGKGVLMVDDENRENEGDLIFPARTMQVTDMAMMIRHCSGIVCLCLDTASIAKLQLPPMTEHNTSRYGTAFTVSVEAKEGVSTGVSAADRIHTIRTACSAAAIASDLAKPGHVFPLHVADNGVLARRGHTEGSSDLMRLADLGPAAVLCELMNEDGSMARLPQIAAFALNHETMVVSVEDIVQYRRFVRNY